MITICVHYSLLLIWCNAYLQAGADVNSTYPDTPLVLATKRGLTDCIEYLLNAGANANISSSCVSIVFPFALFLPSRYSWFLQVC